MAVEDGVVRQILLTTVGIVESVESLKNAETAQPMLLVIVVWAKKDVVVGSTETARRLLRPPRLPDGAIQPTAERMRRVILVSAVGRLPGNTRDRQPHDAVALETALTTVATIVTAADLLVNGDARGQANRGGRGEGDHRGRGDRDTNSHQSSRSRSHDRHERNQRNRGSMHGREDGESDNASRKPEVSSLVLLGTRSL